MKIGNVELKNNVFLGPMAGITDRPFRTLCHEMDCGLVYSEMVSAKGIYYNNENKRRRKRIKIYNKIHHKRTGQKPDKAK